MQYLAFLLLCVGSFIIALCGIWMIVLGFQRHWAWGLALLIPQVIRVAQIMVPPQSQAMELSAAALQVAGGVVYLCFLVSAWPVTKPPFLWSLAGLIVLFAFGALLGLGRVSLSPGMETVLRWQGVKDLHVQFVPNSGKGGPSRVGQQNQQTDPPFSFFGPSSKRATAGQSPAPAVFRSRLPPPRVGAGEREPASPGIFYLLERVTTTTPRGVQAGLPGERVTLLERMPGNRLRVTIGTADFVVYSSQVTDDLNAAREAEKHDFVARGGRL